MNKIIIILLLFSLLVFVGCSSEVIMKEEVSDNPLAGSCAKGNSCDYPSCSAYVDLDSDGYCDRGIE